MGFIDNPPIPGPPGPPGPGGEAGAITLGYPRNATTARFQLQPISPELLGQGDDYNWHDGDTITVDGITYTFKDVLDETHATVTVTATDQVTDGDTITVGNITYRFKNVRVQPYDVLIGADADESMSNLRLAISYADGNVMFTDETTIANPDVYGDPNYIIGMEPITDATLHPIARVIGAAGNALNIPISTTSSAIELSSSAFVGGTTSTVPNQVKINHDDNNWLYGSMYNLSAALQAPATPIEGFGMFGITVSSGTQGSPRFYGNNGVPFDFVARQVGTTYNDLEVTMSRNDLFTYTQVDIGYNATPGTKGEVRMRTDDNGTIWLYAASQDINTLDSQAWRATQLGGF